MTLSRTRARNRQKICGCSKSAPVHAAEVCHAELLAQIGRHKTAGNSRTHQRLSQARRSTFQVLVLVSLTIPARAGKDPIQGACSGDGKVSLAHA
jgi:hypothetical protein